MHQIIIKHYWDLSDDDLQTIYDHAVQENLLDRVCYDVELSRECFCFSPSGPSFSVLSTLGLA